MVDRSLLLSRSEEKLRNVVLRLLHFCNVPATTVFPILYCNGTFRWSLATDTSINLLVENEKELSFLALKAAIFASLREHAALFSCFFIPHSGKLVGNHLELEWKDFPEHLSLPLSILQCSIADRLQLLIDELSDAKAHNQDLSSLCRLHEKGPPPDLAGLPFKAFLEKKTIQMFFNILSEQELHSLYLSFLDNYVEKMQGTVEVDLKGLGLEAKAEVLYELVEKHG